MHNSLYTADLEIIIRATGDNGFAADFSYSISDLPIKEPSIPVSFNFDELNQNKDDNQAYSQFFSRMFFNEERARTIFAQAVASAHSLDLSLRLRLRMDDVRLHNLRWETLRNPQTGNLIAVDENIILSRQLDANDWKRVALRSRTNLKALILAANPRGLEIYKFAPIDAVLEIKLAKEGLGIIQSNSLEKATLEVLTTSLREEAPDILYIVCHGNLDDQNRPWLWLEDENGNIQRVGGDELAERIQNLAVRPALVVLASCQSAGNGNGDALSALGPRLIRAGVPAVLAMQGNISMDTVHILMPAFFTSLQSDGCVDRALAAARGSVRENPDAWMPVLFMRLKSGQIFEAIPLLSEEEKAKNKRKFSLRNKHEFDAPRYLYKPIQETVIELQEKFEKLDGGYIGIFGPPGSGKSTFLTQTLRTLPARLVRYYAYVPDTQDPSVLRGESINFFHDVTLSIQQLGIGEKEQPDPTDRMALIDLFNKQLSLLGKDFETTKTQTIILVDGLDHIAREQHPERSLITDLPSPNAIPKGVYIIIGSQTKELPNLPISIEQTFLQSERIILMGKLNPQNVFDVIHQTLPDIDNSFDQRIYQIVDGHPLSLVYLLNDLLQSVATDNYELILEKTVPYQGNIEEQYFSHWKQIKNDSGFKKFLGLLARMRGPIPIQLVAKWVEEPLLEKLQGVFGQYFIVDSLDRWEFFHNSFRIFLEAKTANALPGKTSEQIDQEYHLNLAQLYEKSDDPWRWETLYHYYRAGEHKRVVDIAQYSWFRAQVEALRPTDAIETDIRLAIKSAGELLDTIALIRYTLIGASLQQRSSSIKGTQLPHLLIETDRSDLAIDYARDGARLRLDDKTALSFCRCLYDANLKREATRIFELAEPLEHLSGRPISEQYAQQQDLNDLLAEWVETASIIRSPIETAHTIRRIQIEPLRQAKNKDIFQASLDLQNWLLRTGALGCCERKDWNGWQIFIDSLDEQRDHQTYYFTLLRTIEHLRKINENDHAKGLLNRLLDMAEPKSFGRGRKKISNLLSIAESVYFLGFDEYQAIAKKWLERINVVPLSDRETSLENSPKLIDLHFRYARLKFLLSSKLTPEKLIKETENQTTYGEYEDGETKLARRQLAFIAYTLAKIWVGGHANITPAPNALLASIKWIFDLIEAGWNSSSATFHLHSEGTKEDISNYLVICASKWGLNTLDAIKNEFVFRWEKDSTTWLANIQRETILTIADRELNYEWAKSQIERIEPFMLRGFDLSGRVEECEKQARAWLGLGEKARALNVLHQLVKSARGIYYEKDYQLSLWANWLHKTNSLEPTISSTRIKKFLRQAFSVEDTTSGVDDALLIILQTVFDISPHKSIQLYKNLLERKAITYEDGMVKLLFSVLESDDPSILTVCWILEDLLFPFARTASPALIKLFIFKANSTLGRKTTIELSERIAKRIKTDVLENDRETWVSGIYDGLNEIGVNPEGIEIQQLDLRRETSSYSSAIDYKLHLSTGEQLNLQDTLFAASTIDGFRELLENENREASSYFKWDKLAINLIKKVPTAEQVYEICDLMDNRIDGHFKETYLVSVYTSASKRLYDLGCIDYSKKIIQKAIKLSKPSGWSSYYDGGVKYDAMRQIIKVSGIDARKEMIKLYVQDLSERHRYPEELIKNLDEIAQVLFDEVPYQNIWPDIENYLDELFSGIVVESQPKLEMILDSSSLTSPDNPNDALAELLILCLDFPAYPISNAAIQVCAKSILAENSIVKNALCLALEKHDQLIRQALIALEIVSRQKPDEISYFQDELAELQKSPNIIIRMIATKIKNNAAGNSDFPPRVDRSVPAIYSLHLPNIVLHNTIESFGSDREPVLLGDPALLLRPLDIEVRKLAKITSIHETNLLYRAAEILKLLETQRTWLFNGLALEPKDLSVFLEKINLRISHYKPKISPCKNSIAHIAAELYDAKKISISDLPLLEFMFRDYDPTLFLVEAKARPEYIERIGGLAHDFVSRLNLPQDWDQTLESSQPLLKSRSANGQIILAEWTHLKRLEENWPNEDRISFLRATASFRIWDGTNQDREKLPFANKINLHTSDYLGITTFSEQELVVAHDGFDYQMGKANWLGLNPRVGFDLGWQPVEGNLFSWKNKNNHLVVESIYWQDGNFESTNWYDHVEVGYGWLVLVTEEGYHELQRRYGVISRAGVISRNLGQFGLKARNKKRFILDNP